MRQTAIIAWCLLVAGSAAAQRPPNPIPPGSPNLSQPIPSEPELLDPSLSGMGILRGLRTLYSTMPATGAPPAEHPQPMRSQGLPRGPASLELLPATNPELVSLEAQGASMTDVLRMIAKNHGLNLVVGPDVTGQVTLSVENAELDEVLDAILGVAGFTWHRRGNLLYVTRLSAAVPMAAKMQGRELRVFSVNYISAADAEGVVTGLLSPVGKAFISEADPLDQTRTREILAVEDIPEALARIEAYLAQVDRPPRQVLVEAHILQVVLDDEHRHGINLGNMMRAGGANIAFETLGHANPDAKSGMLITLKGNDVDALVEMIQSNTVSRTLASPKVLVANRQEANIQIGKRLSYLTTTTTQTSTVQSVQFLDTGVVLHVLPVIGDDGHVLMQIQPKVSGGQTNQNTGLPEEESTELSTTVLLPDGGGVVIGGLIKEDDVDSLSQVPGFSKLPYVGRLFERKHVTTHRTEIIVALVTRVVPTVEMIRQHELEELHKVLPPYAAADLQSSRSQNPDCIVPEYLAPGLFAPAFAAPPQGAVPQPESRQYESLQLDPRQYESLQYESPPPAATPNPVLVPRDGSTSVGPPAAEMPLNAAPPRPAPAGEPPPFDSAAPGKFFEGQWPEYIAPVHSAPLFISPELFSSERGLPQSELLESDWSEPRPIETRKAATREAEKPAQR